MNKQAVCPDFDLAPLTPFPPMVFNSEHKDLDAFVLMLALAFNDFKTVHWLICQLKKGESVKKGITAYDGQVVGMLEHSARLALGLLAELLRAIKEQSPLLSSPLWKNCIQRLQPQARSDWHALVAVATESTVTANKFVGYLIKVRNNFAFHYYQPKLLLQGYSHHFSVIPKSSLNQHAYASLGQKMEATRFYFADAAAQAAVRVQLDPSGQLFKQSQQVLYRVNSALRYLVEVYLVERSKSYEQEG